MANGEFKRVRLRLRFEEGCDFEEGEGEEPPGGGQLQQREQWEEGRRSCRVEGTKHSADGAARRQYDEKSLELITALQELCAYT